MIAYLGTCSHSPRTLRNWPNSSNALVSEKQVSRSIYLKCIVMSQGVDHDIVLAKRTWTRNLFSSSQYYRTGCGTHITSRGSWHTHIILGHFSYWILPRGELSTWPTCVLRPQIFFLWNNHFHCSCRSAVSAKRHVTTSTCSNRNESTAARQKEYMQVATLGDKDSSLIGQVRALIRR